MWTPWKKRVRQAISERNEVARELEATRRRRREVVDPLLDRAEAALSRNGFGDSIELAMGKRRNA